MVNNPKIIDLSGTGAALHILLEKEADSKDAIRYRTGINGLRFIFAQIMDSHPEFRVNRLIIKITITDRYDFHPTFVAHFEHRLEPKANFCPLVISQRWLLQNCNKLAAFYPMFVHEMVHWHDREVVHRWHKSHMVSEDVEIKLLSVILHSLRINGLANIKMFYAKSAQNSIFEPSPHKIREIAKAVEVELDYVSSVRKFKAMVLSFKKSLLKSQNPERDIWGWVMANYNDVYFLGGMMCYFILFMHMIRNNQRGNIGIYLDANLRERIDIVNIRRHLHEKELYFAKVPLNIFEYTYEEIRRLKPAEFFLLYLEACQILGIYYKKLLIFDEPDINLVKTNREKIDGEIK